MRRLLPLLLALAFALPALATLLARPLTAEPPLADPPSVSQRDGLAPLPHLVWLSPAHAADAPSTFARSLGGTLPLARLAPAAVEFIEGRTGLVGAAVIDLEAGVAYAYQPQLRVPLASVLKVPLMLATLERLRLEGVALTATERDWMTRMIRESHNDGAWGLLERIGGAEALARYLDRLDLGTPRFTIEEWHWGASTAGALDVALVLAELAAGELVDASARATALDLMGSVIEEQRWGVSAGLVTVHTGTSLALKNGWWDRLADDEGWNVHSAGIVLGPTGDARYVIVVLTEGQAAQWYGIETIEGVASAINQAMRPSMPWLHPWR